VPQISNGRCAVLARAIIAMTAWLSFALGPNAVKYLHDTAPSPHSS
jgi:hypothetical protein